MTPKQRFFKRFKLLYLVRVMLDALVTTYAFRAPTRGARVYSIRTQPLNLVCLRHLIVSANVNPPIPHGGARVDVDERRDDTRTLSARRLFDRRSAQPSGGGRHPEYIPIAYQQTRCPES